MRWRLLASVAFVLAVVALTVPATAQNEDLIPLTREVEGSAERLGSIRDEIAGVRAELDSLSGRRERADRELTRITREIGLVKQLLAGLDQRERILELQRDTLEVRQIGRAHV